MVWAPRGREVGEFCFLWIVKEEVLGKQSSTPGSGKDWNSPPWLNWKGCRQPGCQSTSISSSPIGKRPVQPHEARIVEQSFWFKLTHQFWLFGHHRTSLGYDIWKLLLTRCSSLGIASSYVNTYCHWMQTERITILASGMNIMDVVMRPSHFEDSICTPSHTFTYFHHQSYVSNCTHSQGINSAKAIPLLFNSSILAHLLTASTPNILIAVVRKSHQRDPLLRRLTER